MEDSNFFVGQSASLVRTVSAEDVEAFAALTGDTNPIHLDEDVASKSRFGRRVAHGMLVASYVSTLLGTKFPGTGTIYVSQTLTFVRPVFLGDTLTVTATITTYRSSKALATIATSVANQASANVVLGEAVCLVRDVAAFRHAVAAAG
jgi:3-hydroxybutyryl-CoA dehydratase